MATLDLYSYYRSSASFRVRIALNLKALPYHLHPVHLVQNGGEQHKAPYKQLNPMAQVPSLVEAGRALGESMAIIEYLNEKYPTPPFFPLDLWERARTRQICEILNSGIQPLQNVTVTQRLQTQFQATPTQINEWILFFIQRGLHAVETLLEETAGTYSLGGEITAADILLVPQYISSQRFQVDLTPYPHFVAVAENCLKLEAFQRARPEAQPDFPG